MSFHCPHCGVQRPIGSVALIQGIVAAYYRIPKRTMTCARRDKQIVRPRQIAMYLARDLTPKSLPAIGLLFGKRDHTTVMHAIKRVEELMHSDMDVANDVAALREQLAQ